MIPQATPPIHRRASALMTWLRCRECQRGFFISAAPGPQPCPHCQATGLYEVGPGAGPHFARLLCGQCQRFIKWLPKPRPVEVQP
jgi:hypothetical protein